MAHPFRVTSLNEIQWRNLGAQWDELVRQSGADPLFLSRDWLSLWWEHFGPCQEDRFACIVVHDDTQIIGGAPFMLGEVRRRPGMRLRSAQCVGFRLHDSRGMLSEYLDAVAIPTREAEVRTAILHHLIDVERCQEVTFGWSRAAENWRICAQQLPRTRGRLDAAVTAYQADLSRGFDHYLGTLGSSTRRSLYNLRRRLEKSGPVQVRIASSDEAIDALDELNRLHATRWGEPAFIGQRLAFHRALISHWRSTNRILLSRLYVANQCVSALYDIRVGQNQYNLQMGFDSKASMHLSLGLLHLGYAMEEAATNGVQHYDFLGGQGMHSDYKRNLSTASQSLRTVQIIHGGIPVLAYRFVDGARECARRLGRFAGTRPREPQL